MADSRVRMRAVLDGYAKFLRRKDLALPKHQPYLVRWVREFLFFAQGHGGYTFEQTLDMFLAEIGRRGDAQPWQIQQAADAARIYRYRSSSSLRQCVRAPHQRPASCSHVVNRLPQCRHPPSLKLRRTCSLLRMSLSPGARLV